MHWMQRNKPQQYEAVKLNLTKMLMIKKNHLKDSFFYLSVLKTYSYP